MSVLASTIYDPVAQDVSNLTSALLAMTALNTTNLRLTFSVPANGAVQVRLHGTNVGNTTYPRVLLGVLEGATVRMRQSPIGGLLAALGTDQMGFEASAVIAGLTPGASLTWDAAYGVEAIVASTRWNYGGPNTNAGNNTTGAFTYEIWDAIGLLGSAFYDPGTAATQSGSALTALTAFDTTNLRVTFKVPTSGNVMWRVAVPWIRGATVWGQILLGVLEGATVRGRVAPQRGIPATSTSGGVALAVGSAVVTGLTPGASLTWDAAFAVQVVSAATIVSYGGPNNTTGNDAWGGAAFEVWAA